MATTSAIGNSWSGYRRACIFPRQRAVLQKDRSVFRLGDLRDARSCGLQSGISTLQPSDIPHCFERLVSCGCLANEQTRLVVRLRWLNLLNLYTHFVALSSLAALMVAALGCILLKFRRREPIKPTLGSSVMAFSIIMLAYLPALSRLGRMVQLDAERPGSVGPGWEIFDFVYIQSPGLVNGSIILPLPWPSWASLGGFRFPRGIPIPRRNPWLVYLLFRNHGHVLSSPRYVSFVMPYFAIAIGTGLAATAQGIQLFMAQLRPDIRHVGAMTTAL